MQIYRDSLILSLIQRLWYFICDTFKGGLFYRIAMRLVGVFKNGLLFKLGCSGASFDSAWESSRFRQFVEWCMNLVPRLLHRLYLKIKPTADESFALSLLCEFGNHADVFLCIVVFAMLIIPQERWNNLYSLIFAFAVLVIYWCGGIKNTKKSLSLEHVGPFPCIYAVCVFMSLLWSCSFALSFRFIFFAITCMIFVILFVNSVDSEDRIMSFLMVLGTGLAIGAACAFYQRITGIEPSTSFTDLELNANMPGRVFSFFENPNSYASLLVYFTPLMLCMFFFAPKRGQRLFFLAVFALCLPALVMTYSRGAWLSFAFSMFILVCLLGPRWLPLFIVAGTCCIPILPKSMISRILTIFNLSDSSTNTRTYIYAGILRLIGKNPIFGVGLGSDAVKRAVAFYDVYHHPRVPFVHAHDLFFQVYAESGIFGLLSFILSLFFTVRSGIRRLRVEKTPSMLRGVIAGCISGIAGTLLFSIPEYPWAYPRVMVFFWLLFAVLLTAVRVSKENEKAGIYNVQ